MLIMEFMKASCLWEMNDEMEWESIRLWRAVAGRLWRVTIVQSHRA